MPVNRETEAGHCQEGPGRGRAGAGRGAGKIRGCVGGGRQRERSLEDRSGCHTPDLGGPRVPEEGSWPTGDRPPQLVLEVSVPPSLPSGPGNALTETQACLRSLLAQESAGAALFPAPSLGSGTWLALSPRSHPAQHGVVASLFGWPLLCLAWGCWLPSHVGGGWSQVLGGLVGGRGQVGGVVAWHLEPQGQQGSPILALSFGQNPQMHSLL